MRNARWAITALFALCGALSASLFSRLPAIRTDLGLSEGELGVALLGAPLGLVVAQPLAAVFVGRIGSRPIALTGALASCAAATLPTVAADRWSLTLTLVVLGATSGTLDLAMNAQGIVLEQQSHRPVFSSLHASYSFGALGGAAVSAVAAELGLRPPAHLLLVSVATAAVVLVGIRPRLLRNGTDGGRRDGGSRARLRLDRSLAGLAAVALAVVLAEGAVTDWSAVYLDDPLGASPGVAAGGLVTFSLAMGFGRLAGDHLAEAFGPVVLVRSGAGTAAVGVLVVVLAPAPWLAITGFLLLGAGLSTIFPLVLLAAGRGRGTATGAALATVSTAGYVGLVLGPPLIGLAAEATNLRVGLGLLCVLCTFALLLAGSAGPAAGAAPAEPRGGPLPQAVPGSKR